MQNYHLICTLGSSLVMKHPRTLDASIGGMLFQKGVDGQEAMRMSGFFDEWNDVPMASNLFFVRRPSRANAVVNTCYDQSFNRLITERANKTVPNLRRSSSLSTYETLFDPDDKTRIEFFFRGDAEKVVSLIEEIGTIGTYGRKGHGQITEVECHPCHEDDEPFGIIRSRNSHRQLIRPVPIALIDKLGLEPSEVVRALGRYRSPYGPHVALKFGLPSELIAQPRAETV